MGIACRKADPLRKRRLLSKKEGSLWKRSFSPETELLSGNEGSLRKRRFSLEKKVLSGKVGSLERDCFPAREGSFIGVSVEKKGRRPNDAFGRRLFFILPWRTTGQSCSPSSTRSKPDMAMYFPAYPFEKRAWESKTSSFALLSCAKP